MLLNPAPSSRQRRPALAFAWPLALCLGLACGPGQANPAWQQGRALFLGEQPLPARVGSGPGATQLAPAASRCVNCHSAPGIRGAGDTTRFGPALNAGWLQQLQARRGGPPSRYDASALCRLLQQGIDPAGVMLPQAMPRYQLNEQQCLALWTLLTSDL